MQEDIQAIIDEFKRLPLRGVVHIKAEYIRRILKYIEELELRSDYR